VRLTHYKKVWIASSLCSSQWRIWAQFTSLSCFLHDKKMHMCFAYKMALSAWAFLDCFVVLCTPCNNGKKTKIWE
jgi:hypothetical protein